MSEAVKPTRTYRSPLRAAQAASTRAQVLDAARTLFAAQGYPATTVAAIAREAGVAAKTIYLAFGSKSGVLRALWDLVLKGDDSPAPVAERPWYLEVLEEPDPEQQLRRNARNARAVKERIAPVLQVIRDGAPVDADVAALWELIQTDFHANQRVIVESLAEKGALATGLDVDAATDILWTLNHPDLWFLLVGRCGWTPDHFETWFADTCCAQLLAPTPTR
jgi:AcrR family transcriptional regulator